MPKGTLKTFKKNFLCSKEKVAMSTGKDRQDHNITTANNRTDATIIQ